MIYKNGTEPWKRYFYITLISILIIFVQTLAADDKSIDKDDLFDMSIEELMDIEVISVSKKEDTLFKSPAAITVITSEDIRRSGHQSIPEVLRMVPGIRLTTGKNT